MSQPNRNRTLLICLLLAAATLVVYWPVLHHQFIIYDDNQYILQNPHVTAGLSWAGFKWAFTSTYASNWHPLTWLSHMLDAQLFGSAPAGHHLTNLLLHTLNTVLVFLALQRLTGAFWRSALVAALFGLHPSHVESVAWAAERKDVLSGCFFLLTLLAYAKYAGAEEGGENGSNGTNPTQGAEASHFAAGSDQPSRGEAQAVNRNVWYLLALVWFACGLMAKPMLVTLPFVLLLLDYWPLGRLELSSILHPPFANLRRLLLEKLPFLALSAAACLLTYWAQKRGGAVASLEHVAFDQRMANALMAYLVYLEKLFWPSKLAIMYLAPDQWPLEQLGLAVFVLAMLSLLAWVLRRSHPYVAVGWLWYVGTLVPVIGLVQVGNQFMADRYTYLPSLGVFIAVTWCVVRGACWGVRKASGGNLPDTLAFPGFKAFGALAILAVLCLLPLALTTRRQVAYWLNTETLFTHCLAVTQGNHIAHDNLGVALANEKRYAEAKEHFRAALEIRPGDADTLHNLGIALVQEGNFEEGLGYLRQAAAARPEFVAGYLKLAAVLDAKGQTAHVADCYREYLRAQPDDLQVCNNLAWLLATCPDAAVRNGPEAVRLAEHACQLTQYQQAIVIGSLAAAYAEAGRFPDAISAAEKAIARAGAAGDPALAERNRQLLMLYRAGKAYHEPVQPTSMEH